MGKKDTLVKMDMVCGELVEVYKSDDSTLLFIPIEYSSDSIEQAFYYASKYAMDIWLDGSCDSFDIYLLDTVKDLDTPHVYVKLFSKDDKVIN